MKILKFFFVIIYCINLSSAHAEIFYIDIDKIINQTIVGNHINNKFNDLKKKNDTKNLENKRELKKREETLIAQKKILKDEDFNNKLNIFQKDVNDFNRISMETNQDIQNKLMNDKSNFLKLIEPILLDYVAENNINYLLQKKYIIVGHNDLNKTQELIKIINKKINISNFNDSVSK